MLDSIQPVWNIEIIQLGFEGVFTSFFFWPSSESFHSLCNFPKKTFIGSSNVDFKAYIHFASLPCLGPLRQILSFHFFFKSIIVFANKLNGNCQISWHTVGILSISHMHIKS